MNLIDNRQIRVFISSTFQDMQGERDYLMKRTFPKLRQIASQRDVMLTELDLRWGITEEEAKSGKVVDICLREIENSVPFFIGIIGNRYGWVPDASDLGGDVTKRFPAVTKYLDKHLSVTEMEMQFGVLERKEDMHAFFYIKEPEAESDNLIMLRRLKEAVKASRYPSSTYTSLGDLAGQVEKAFIALLDQLFPEVSLSDHQKEKLVQRSFIRRLCSTYVKVGHNFEVLDRFAEDPSLSYLVVTGDSGMGKSAFLANWAKENEYGERFSVIPYFSSNGGNQLHKHIIKYLAAEITERYSLDQVQASDAELLDKVFELFSVKEEKLVIVIDAINQIADVEQAKRLNWLPIPPKNVKFLFSTLKEDTTMEVFRNRHYPIFTLHPLTNRQRQTMVSKYLKSYSKKLQPYQIKRIVTDEQCENTLVLRSFLDELVNFGRYEKLDEKIEMYLGAHTIEDFYLVILKNYEDDFGEDFVKRILGLIAVSRDGISEESLIRITGVKPFDWSSFYCSFSTHLNNQSGRLVFTHSYITSTVWNRYVKDDSAFESACRSAIADCLFDQNGNYAMQEVPYQLDKLKDWHRLHDYITSYDYLVYCMDYDEVEIATYWRHVFEGCPDKYSLEDYVRCRPEKVEDVVQMYVKLLRLCRVLCLTPPKEFFVKMLCELIVKHPEMATSKVYQALSESSPSPDNLRYAQISLELSKKENDVLSEIESLRQIGGAYYWMAVRDKKEDCVQKACDVWEEARVLSVGLYGEIHPLVMHAYKDIGIFTPDLQKGLELTLKAVDLGIMIYGPDHPLVGRPYHYVGCVYNEMKRWEEALPYLRKACSVWLPAYGLNHEIMNSSYAKQGQALMNMGRLDEALECFDTCLRILDVIEEEPGYFYADRQLRRAQIMAKKNRVEDALVLCDEVESILRKEKVAAEAWSMTLLNECQAFRKELLSRV